MPRPAIKTVIDCDVQYNKKTPDGSARLARCRDCTGSTWRPARRGRAEQSAEPDTTSERYAPQLAQYMSDQDYDVTTVDEAHFALEGPVPGRHDHKQEKPGKSSAGEMRDRRP